MLYYMISIILVVIDQAVKWWVRSAIPLGESIPFLPPLMDLTHVQNTGAAFSSFSGMTPILTLVSLAAAAVLWTMLWNDFFPGKWGKLALSLVLAGAVGNFIDRAALGYVTDMFETTFITFAVFNVADICVVVGGVLMVVYVLFLWDGKKEEKKDPEEPKEEAIEEAIEETKEEPKAPEESKEASTEGPKEETKFPEEPHAQA